MTTMNTKVLTIAAMMVTGSLNAVADNHFTPYGEEMSRCVTEARDTVLQSTTRQIRHFVTERGTAGVWAEFDIRTELYDRRNGPMVKSVESRCRAHRWNDQTVLEQ